MRFKIFSILICFTLITCIEPYQFKIKNENAGLTIESHISNVSYIASKDFPGNGRFFEVLLHRTSDVINIRDEPIIGAVILLKSDAGGEWYFSEQPVVAGSYQLLDEEFAALEGEKYQLIVTISDEEEYRSAWESLPETKAPEMGQVSFSEMEKLGYVYESAERVVRSIKGIDLYIDLPQHDKEVFYKWNFIPTWVFIASKTSRTDPNHYCWSTDPFYLNGFTLQNDKLGGYQQRLNFIETIGNDRIYEDFSLLVQQWSMTESYYNFWEELERQSQSAGLFDQPPYTILSNFETIKGNESASGYFGVVREQAKRWYINRYSLSYILDNEWQWICDYQCMGCPAPECRDCRFYSKGDAKNQKPSWWH